jgi:copper chaperone CopZ
MVSCQRLFHLLFARAVAFFPVLTLLFPLIRHSEGCASAVKRILGKIDGVNDVQTDVAAKTVIVQANDSVSPQLMLEKLQKVSQKGNMSVMTVLHRCVEGIPRYECDLHVFCFVAIV